MIYALKSSSKILFRNKSDIVGKNTFNGIDIINFKLNLFVSLISQQLDYIFMNGMIQCFDKSLW